MDWEGLSSIKSMRFPLDRNLTTYEKNNELDKQEKINVKKNDYLTVVEIGKTHMELVDRWYAQRGGVIFFALSLMLVPLLFLLSIFPVMVLGDNPRDSIYFCLFVLILSPPIIACIYGLSLEAFKKTYYPIRLDRRNRLVHAMLPRGEIISVKWDDLFIFIKNNHIPLMGNGWYEIRAHVLSEDKTTVLKTFTLGYPPWASKEDALSLWEFIRGYMAKGNEYQECIEKVKLCMPIKDKREPIRFCIFRGMSWFYNAPTAQLLLSPVLAVFIWCRVIAVYTSKIPKWPIDIEEYNDNIKGEELKNSNNNIKLKSRDWLWPQFCFYIGSVVSAVSLYFSIQYFLNSIS
ncbi:DUF6708 domain-containing protein [Cobetia marina]|uniref:DUF6708 domain-containing protein n=1 Tax=Cobetia marina TaxID=28258 RepID=UPI0025489D59|nr:DUF6708 domain-containing protein [Cobetia pacifica]MDI6002359.1 hypothetical protein [Cobetia pacifica]